MVVASYRCEKAALPLGVLKCLEEEEICIFAVAVFAKGKNAGYLRFKKPIKLARLTTFMRLSTLHKFFCISAGLLASGSLALLSGCKGNTSAAAAMERTVAPPPVVMAYPVGTSALVDPLSGGSWTNARWLPLLPPVNTERTTAPVSAATLYDATSLYVAFISNKPAGNVAMDTVSVYLDSSSGGTGADMLQVTINKEGVTTCSWIRDAEPPVKARDDGSPDAFHPVSKIPNLGVAGLRVKTGESVQNGVAVWTAVVAIPLKSLPTPLRTMPVPGSHWKLNLLRTTVLGDTGSGSEQLQANLSPIYVASQAVSPYRMAELDLVSVQVSVLPVRSGKHS